MSMQVGHGFHRRADYGYSPRPMTVVLIILTAWILVIGILHAAVLPWLRRGPQEDALTGAMWRLARLYSIVWQRARFEGLDKLPTAEGHGGLIVVSNHTGSVDPILIQSGCRFFVRWMMASEMMHEVLDWFWDRYGIIGVDRDGKDSGPLRTAIRHVKGGGAVGIFPEGRIVTPPREIWPFLAGVGLLVTRTRAPVMLVWVSGTPDTNGMIDSLRQRGRAQVKVLDLIDYSDWKNPTEVADDLRRRLVDASGWPANDSPPPRPGP